MTVDLGDPRDPTSRHAELVRAMAGLAQIKVDQARLAAGQLDKQTYLRRRQERLHRVADALPGSPNARPAAEQASEEYEKAFTAPAS